MTIMNYPVYTHPCDEVLQDHARHLVVHQYVGCIKIPNAWAVPNVDEILWLDTPALVDVLTGSCLWNPDFGYFKIVSFDREGQKIGVQRKIVEGTALAGVAIPSCTKFIFTPDI